MKEGNANDNGTCDSKGEDNDESNGESNDEGNGAGNGEGDGRTSLDGEIDVRAGVKRRT